MPLIDYKYFCNGILQPVRRYTDSHIHTCAHLLPEGIFAVPGSDTSVRSGFANHIACQIGDFDFGVGYQAGDGDNAGVVLPDGIRIVMNIVEYTGVFGSIALL